MSKQPVQMGNLLHRIGLAGLLAVPERGIGNPNLIGHIDGDHPEVEYHLGDFVVVKKVPVQVGVPYVLQRDGLGRAFQKVGFFIKLEHGMPPFIRWLKTENRRLAVGF